MSYYNTTNSEGRELDSFKIKAKAQELKVLAYFQAHPFQTFTPEDIGRAVLPNAPRTSWGRALSNLTKDGALEKTDRQSIGMYGRPVYHWRLASREPSQLSLTSIQETVNHGTRNQ